ncbi:MAG: hypothetical protein PHI44_05640 [Candidatus Ratteibacteria bacterium]|nr:hypothetical protein [Candidatus Ratteibacteria bacterium]
MDIDEAKKFLSRTKEKDRVPGAYLIYAGSRSQRNECATFLSKLLHCKKTPPCNSCIYCRQIENRSHPDTKWIIPSKSILSIDDIRWVKENIYITPYYGGKKIYIFEIDYMRDEAANAFLKILEEPPAYGVLIIQSSNINFFLPTIVSRCQKIRLNYALPEYSDDMEKVYQQFTDILKYVKRKDYFGFFKAVDAFVEERGREEMEEDTGRLLLIYRDLYLKKAGIPEEMLVKKDIDGGHLHTSNRNNLLEVMEKLLELKGRIRYNINLKLALDNLFLYISSE